LKITHLPTISAVPNVFFNSEKEENLFFLHIAHHLSRGPLESEYLREKSNSILRAITCIKPLYTQKNGLSRQSSEKQNLSSFTIDNFGTNNNELDDGTILSDNLPDPMSISATKIVSELNGTDVLLWAGNNIDVIVPIDASGNANSHGLTLQSPVINIRPQREHQPAKRLPHPNKQRYSWRECFVEYRSSR